jgi:hypothetical protein
MIFTLGHIMYDAIHDTVPPIQFWLYTLGSGDGTSTLGNIWDNHTVTALQNIDNISTYGLQLIYNVLHYFRDINPIKAQRWYCFFHMMLSLWSSTKSIWLASRIIIINMPGR